MNLVINFFKSVLNFLVKILIKIGDVLGFVKTKIIIGFLFFCVFYPIGIIGKLFGKQFLDKKIDKNIKTYFEKISKDEKHSFNDQF